MDCGYDYNLERSILYILKKCCPGITECTQVKGTTFHPIAPFPTSAVLLGGRYNVQTSDITMEPVKVNLLDAW